MKRLLLLAALSLTATAALAQTAPAWNENQIRVTPPTTCVNGHPIAECPYSGFQIERAALPAGPFATITTLLPTVTTYTHIAQAGQNCYRAIVTASIPYLPSAPSDVICKTNTAPVPPNPPAIQFVTVTATRHSLTDWTPVATIVTSGGQPAYGTIVGLVPVDRPTQSAPIYRALGYNWCRVEVGKRETFIDGRSLLNLAAPCAPRA